MDANIKITGLKEIQRKLDKISRFAFIGKAVRLGAETIIDEAGQYPPQQATASSRWYKRGYGDRWASGGRRTSENLGKRWYTKMKGTTSVIIGNMASYAVYVHGRLQASFHGRAGWKKLEDVAKKVMPKITKSIQAEIAKIWRR